MSRHEKVLEKVLGGQSDANIRFADLCSLLSRLGFVMRVKGSHHLFVKNGVMAQINLQADGTMAKPYQVRQVRKILQNYPLA
ncbi:MAG: type II toxin-antitoxin system HicA family toxin [Verrucomicrobia bacterium]|nr:type II toxin-antitoxin system HicA family toxin [Verrucomicrobiota bacterium]